MFYLFKFSDRYVLSKHSDLLKNAILVFSHIFFFKIKATFVLLKIISIQFYRTVATWF